MPPEPRPAVSDQHSGREWRFTIDEILELGLPGMRGLLEPSLTVTSGTRRFFAPEEHFWKIVKRGRLWIPSIGSAVQVPSHRIVYLSNDYRQEGYPVAATEMVYKFMRGKSSQSDLYFTPLNGRVR